MQNTLRASRTLLGSAGILMCLGLASCAGDEATEKRLGALQAELDRVQNRADRLEERLTAVEVQNQKRTVRIDEDTEASDRPTLKVVKLSPDDSLEPAAATPEGAAKQADDDGPRPVIRATGQGEGRIDHLDAAEPTPAKKDKTDGD